MLSILITLVLGLPSTGATEGADGKSPDIPSFICGTSTGESDTIPSSAVAVPTIGEQRTIVTLVNYLNDPSEPYTVGQIEAEILDETNPDSAASYYREGSYGRAWLTGSVEGWFSMDWDDADCNLWQDSETERLIDALDPFIDFSIYDRWIVVIPMNSNCSFSGISTIGTRTFDTADGTVELSRAILNGADLHPNLVAAHELAHGFAAVQHASDYECGEDVIRDSCRPSGLGSMTDRYDIMGHVWYGGHFSPPNKEQLGWLAGDVLDVAPPGGTYSLVPYEVPDSGIKVLRVPVEYITDDFADTTYYYIHYRKPLGFDDTFTELWEDGAMVTIDNRRFADQSYGRSGLLDLVPHLDIDATTQTNDSADVILRVGQTYVDAEKGIEITVTASGVGSLEVSVSITKYCGNGTVDSETGEECDGADLGGQTCGSLGRMEGTLACSADCRFDMHRCGMSRCFPGSTYNLDETCTATFLSDTEDGGLWRNQPTWDAARESSAATGFVNLTAVNMINHRIPEERSWIYRDSFPFDTSAIPDDATVLSGRLELKVVRNPGLVNTHPESADSLVLVRAGLSDPPTANLDDYDQFGTLNDPVEGASRIDVSEQVVEEAPISFLLNAEGLGWIDPAGWTNLGIRAGYDTDNIVVPGEEMQFRVQFRSSDSLVFGPRLSATVSASPAPVGGAAGAVPDAGGLPGAPLTIGKGSGGAITLQWDQSCVASDSDYEIYEGILGTFDSHTPRFCSTEGLTSKTMIPGPGDRYYLVAPRSADREGSLGVDSQGAERPESIEGCVPRQIGSCS